MHFRLTGVRFSCCTQSLYTSAISWGDWAQHDTRIYIWRVFRNLKYIHVFAFTDPSNQVCHELPLHVAMANDDQIMGSESSHDQPTRPQRQQRHQPSPQKQADQHLPQTETAATTDIIDPKKLRNRAAASKCRKKKLQRMEEMRKETDEKVAENEKLAKQVKNLQSQLSHMRHLLATHRNNGQCRILVQSTSRSDGV